MLNQLPLFSDHVTRFPSTRYQGSKARLTKWIMEQVGQLKFETCLDAFSGTGSVAWQFKRAGKRVTCNDLLRFNYHIGQALVENSSTRLSDEDVEEILTLNHDRDYPTFVQDTFADIYFTDEENAWIDRTITNIHHIRDPYKFALAFFSLAQSCTIKRPYNLFHRKNLYLRFADVERSFGNKASWDRPFEEWFRIFAKEANIAVFDNQQENRAFNSDAMSLEPEYDLVYLDPPYISGKGTGTDYRDFYHFLEGLTMYGQWLEHVDQHSSHRRLRRVPNAWSDKNRIYEAFESIFERFQDCILVVSYRTDGIPSKSQLIQILGKFKPNIQVACYGRYQYALSTNRQSDEMLLVAP